MHENGSSCPQPPAPALKPRTLMRRRQVMEAAGRCFRRHGFHSCSMAQISAEAGMSVGHIYRYFTSKEAIIEAIAEADVEDIVAHMNAFPMDAADVGGVLRERMLEGAMRALDPEKASLMLEIRAEAAHNPAVAKVVREGDQIITQRSREIVRAAVGRPLDEADLSARVELVHLVFQGMTLRTVVNPELDREALAGVVRLMLDGVLG